MATATTLFLNITMSDIYILSIETATPLCSVSLAKNGVTLHEIVGEEPNMHASSLTLFIDQLLQKASLQMKDLSAIAVSKGPGSYTGLRIGVSAAKGLCYALDIPMIANNTLGAMYHGFMAISGELSDKTLLFPMIDARRQEVYTQVLGSQAQVIETTKALIVDATSFDSYLAEGYHLIFFGSGADKFEEQFQENPAIQVALGFDAKASFQDALSYEKFQAGEFEDVAYFEPYYLKDFMVTAPKKSPLL